MSRTVHGIASCGLAILVCLGFSPDARAQTIIFDPPHTSVDVGETFTVRLLIDPNGQEVMGIALEADFDEEIVGLEVRGQGNESLAFTTSVGDSIRVEPGTAAGVLSFGQLKRIFQESTHEPGPLESRVPR